jgi:hypothetical protein
MDLQLSRLQLQKFECSNLAEILSGGVQYHPSWSSRNRENRKRRNLRIRLQKARCRSDAKLDHSRAITIFVCRATAT